MDVKPLTSPSATKIAMLKLTENRLRARGIYNLTLCAGDSLIGITTSLRGFATCLRDCCCANESDNTGGQWKSTHLGFGDRNALIVVCKRDLAAIPCVRGATPQRIFFGFGFGKLSRVDTIDCRGINRSY